MSDSLAMGAERVVEPVGLNRAPESAAPRQPAAALSLARRIRSGILASRTLTAGLLLLGTLLVFAAVTAVVLPNPNRQDLAASLTRPGSAGHLLGADYLGHDVLAWVGGGIRIGVSVSVCVVAIGATGGVLVGIVAGYFGGPLDSVLMRVVDLQLAIPPLLLFIAAAAVIRPTTVSLIFLLSTVAWVPYARIVRAKILTERERGYISAARLAGVSHARIMFVHLLRSTATLVLVFASLQFGYVLLWETSLSFIKLGIRPPQTSLGYLIAQGSDDLVGAWWVVVFPGLAIMALVLAANLIGDGLRDVFQADVPDGAV